MAHHASLHRAGGPYRTTTGDPHQWLVSEILLNFHLGNLVPGDRLPPVRELADELCVSPRTALEIYKELENEGFVEGRQRSGVFLRRLGVDVERGKRQAALFEALRCAAGKLELLGVPPGEFARLFLLSTGVRRREDLTFAFVTHQETYEIFSLELQRRLKFELPATVLPPENEEQARTCLAHDRSIGCLLATSLYATAAFELARDYNLRMIVLRLDRTAARLLDPTAAGKRYVVMRDADCAAAVARLAGTVRGEQITTRLRVISLDDLEGLAEMARDAAEVYASPVCFGRVRALCVGSRTVRPLPSALSQETIDDILFQYLFAPQRTPCEALPRPRLYET